MFKPCFDTISLATPCFFLDNPLRDVLLVDLPPSHKSWRTFGVPGAFDRTPLRGIWENIVLYDHATALTFVVNLGNDKSHLVQVPDHLVEGGKAHELVIDSIVQSQGIVSCKSLLLVQYLCSICAPPSLQLPETLQWRKMWKAP